MILMYKPDKISMAQHIVVDKGSGCICSMGLLPGSPGVDELDG